MEHELGGDRAVIIGVCPSRYIEFLYFSVKRQHWYRECLCRDNLFFCVPEAATTAKWRDVLEREQFSSRIMSISVDEAHVSQNGEFIAS